MATPIGEMRIQESSGTKEILLYGKGSAVYHGPFQIPLGPISYRPNGPFYTIGAQTYIGEYYAEPLIPNYEINNTTSVSMTYQVTSGNLGFTAELYLKYGSSWVATGVTNYCNAYNTPYVFTCSSIGNQSVTQIMIVPVSGEYLSLDWVIGGVTVTGDFLQEFFAIQTPNGPGYPNCAVAGDANTGLVFYHPYYGKVGVNQS